jgi:hypothetical protein
MMVIIFAHLCCPCSLLGRGSDSIKSGSDKPHDARETVPGAKDEGTNSLLRRLASEQIVTDSEFLGKTRLRIDPQAQTLYYDLTPAPLKFVLAVDDPYAEPLEAFIRVESLRRDFRIAVPNDAFWDTPLRSIDDLAEQCVRDQDSGQRGTSGKTSCSTRVERGFDSLHEAILKFASVHHLMPIAPTRYRGSAPGYRVQIKVDPPRAHVKVMPLLEYKKYQFFKTPENEYHWIDLLEPEIEMIGFYHYRAEWPKELNGRDEGDIEIKKPATITFTPPER